MITHYDIEKFDATNPIVTLGTFDGVHKGHRKILKRLKEIARETGGETVIITFHPHPRIVLNKDKESLRLLSTPGERANLFEKAGIDHLVMVRFTQAFAEMTSEEFIEQILIDKIGVKTMVVGYDHAFGKGREGNFEVLEKYGQKHGFTVEEIPAEDIENNTISSTRIRNALFEGDIKTANHLLDYRYMVSGRVMRGNQIGKLIGFPTVNLEVENSYKLIPGKGVYAVQVEWNGKVFNGMGNIGFRPTISTNHLTLEAHIFDFEQDIYDESITLYFIDRIRDEKKFGNLDLLKKQLHQDREAARKIFDG
ncbi:MAG: bifunctional riboflavin kinase/FAD synthetase [Bacteroidales bacterium]|nr:bifunctional riboflavin kinase/FAD synthetase [Bacteroidales bacterium]